jgi:hypothetical protein
MSAHQWDYSSCCFFSLCFWFSTIHLWSWRCHSLWAIDFISSWPCPYGHARIQSIVVEMISQQSHIRSYYGMTIIWFEHQNWPNQFPAYLLPYFLLYSIFSNFVTHSVQGNPLLCGWSTKRECPGDPPLPLTVDVKNTTQSKPFRFAVANAIQYHVLSLYKYTQANFTHSVFWCFFCLPCLL